ncbi:hypothetical protein E1B28_004950 [Marasmius oreades]|uniref:Uncharacterized protein n=1 Tax=Marasmius oreades TaxID=181124 RepID=A0A9P8ADC0_9AGAR|nr:uncharacterized protein E1B28_004950 [Marasmius oreades]KAG7097616.1 hypothetical protein E1B28_004950 [Marasmius oreades]
MSFFQGANGVSIGQGTFNAVTGNQTNNNIYVEGQKKERRIYDEFPDIQRGLVHRLKDLAHKDRLLRWNSSLMNYEVEFTVERTTSTAKIHGDSSSFIVVSYKGQDAEKAWKKDFREFSETTNTTTMQLFGINRSKIPLLIFFGELVPLAHLSLGQFGRGYASTFAFWNMSCEEAEIWIDPKQGTLVRGVEGPHCDLDCFIFTARALPPSVELLLQEDVCFRYFSRLPLDKEFDRRVIDEFRRGFEIGCHVGPPIIGKPCVFSSKTNSIIAVGDGSHWNGYGCLEYQVVMPDGRTRFTLTDKRSELTLYSDPFGHHCAWLSQASSVFLRLGILLDEEHWSYELSVPYIKLKGSTENSSIQQQRRSEVPPIYFFLHPLPPFPLGDGSVLSIHTWSHDENGETPIPHHHCNYLGLPTELSLAICSSNTFYWPSEVYKSIHKWQVARGFDPTTADFARYLDHPIYEVLLESEAGRFEELNIGLSGRSSAEESLSQDDQWQYSTLAACNTEEDPMNVNWPTPASLLHDTCSLSMDVDVELDECSIRFEGLSTTSASIADMEVD